MYIIDMTDGCGYPSEKTNPTHRRFTMHIRTLAIADDTFHFMRGFVGFSCDGYIPYKKKELKQFKLDDKTTLADLKTVADVKKIGLEKLLDEKNGVAAIADFEDFTKKSYDGDKTTLELWQETIDNHDDDAAVRIYDVKQ